MGILSIFLSVAGVVVSLVAFCSFLSSKTKKAKKVPSHNHGFADYSEVQGDENFGATVWYHYDEDGNKVVDMIAAKPVIYLYPEEETDVQVRLHLNGSLTCTYPDYAEGWNVIAHPDGKIFDKNTKRTYDYLFWEGNVELSADLFAKSACVSAEDSAEFLETYLEAAGLNDSEIDDFVSYWLPKLQSSPYNQIAFPYDEYCESAKMDVYPQPETEIRIYMVFRPLEAPIDIPEDQQMELPSKQERNGFTVVEWGGSEYHD